MMSGILQVARMTCLLLHRRRTLWGIIALVAGLTASIYFLSAGDEVLQNELQLRIHYSYALSYSLISLIMIALSCFTIRTQIDAKQIHMLTTLPIRRADIWLGKWLAMIVVAVLVQASMFATLAICSWAYARQYPVAEQQAARAQVMSIRYRQQPQRPSIRALTRQHLERVLPDIAGQRVDDNTWQLARQAVSRQLQLLPPGGKKQWRFDLGSQASRGKHIELEFQFFSDKRRDQITGVWQLTSPDSNTSFESPFSVLPFEANVIQVPVEYIPASGRIELTLQSTHDREVVVTWKNGVFIYYNDGHVAYNVAKALGLQTLHLAAISAVGLTTGVAFTFSVSSFLAIVLFFLSTSSRFFAGLAEEMMDGYHKEFGEQLGVIAMRAGLWLSKGLEPPGVVEWMSTGISIPLGEMATSWLPGSLLYLALTVTIGIVLLTRKELDKVSNQI